jgi:lipopolysaccharide/colanic/teichoic acid biosynthesis glycosyltransferase
MKRILDVAVASVLLALLSPLLAMIALLIFMQDFHSPFYIAPRVGRDGRLFRMVKFRSMIVNADKTGVTSTAATDRRITPIGAFVRRYKLDELVQLWNVLKGDMSLVGPRPNVKSATDSYTSAERGLLAVRPGITDLASIVFADEGEILQGHPDADVAYDQLIRPWKSRLGLFYVQHTSVSLDLKLIWLTAVAIVSRRRALQVVHLELVRRDAASELVRIALRARPLEPATPPGAPPVVLMPFAHVHSGSARVLDGR